MADQSLFARPDAPHGVHDLLLIAAYAAGDLTGPDHDRAAALVAACGECAALHADLRALDGIAATVPAPPRPRDFRLTPTDAARLRRRNAPTTVLAAHRPRFHVPQGLAAAITALGLAGLLVTTVPFQAASPGAATGDAGGASRGQLAQPAASGDGFEAQASLEAALAAPGVTAAPTSIPPASDVEAGAVPGDPGRAAVAVASAGLVAAGIALLVAARRRRLRA